MSVYFSKKVWFWLFNVQTLKLRISFFQFSKLMMKQLFTFFTPTSVNSLHTLVSIYHENQYARKFFATGCELLRMTFLKTDFRKCDDVRRRTAKADDELLKKRPDDDVSMWPSRLSMLEKPIQKSERCVSKFFLQVKRNLVGQFIWRTLGSVTWCLTSEVTMCSCLHMRVHSFG